MGRPRQISDEQIIAAARRVFLEGGVKATVNEVARDLGVSHTALFARFGTKEALLVAAFAPPVSLPFTPVLRRGPDERSIREQLRALAALFVRYFEELGQGWALLQAAGISVEKVFAGRSRPSPLVAHRQLERWVQRAQERGLLAVTDAGVFAWTFLGALHLRVFQAALRGGPARAPELETFVDLLLEGAAP